MAEEQQQDSKDIIDHHSDDLREEKTQTHDLHKPENFALDGEQPHSALSSTTVNGEAKTSSDKDMPPVAQAETKMEGDLADQTMALLTEETSPPRDDDAPNMEDFGRCQAGDASHGDCVRESQKVEEPDGKADATSGDHAKDKKARGTIFPQVLDGSKDEQVDEPTALPDEDSTAADNIYNEAGEDVAPFPEEEKDVQNNTTSQQMPFLQKASVVEELDVKRSHVETIRPTTIEDTVPVVPDATGRGRGRYFIAVGVVALIAMLLQCHFQQELPPQKNDLQQIDIFLKQMEKVKTQFPSQRADLWNRSKIHLKRHLQTPQPTEPVSLILTAGLRAERTLHCLAQSLAFAFSSALNASVLHIDGASTANQDSDQVKLDIDSKLQGAFGGDKPVAVIHRFEELPPGSTLIFYRYCDHENAAYKKTFLIFTVLLGEEDEISEKIHLSTVEEMVDDHLQKKFLSHDYPVSFDRMDLDKYGGLWSRISHLILPVAAEKRIELEGC